MNIRFFSSIIISSLFFISFMNPELVLASAANVNPDHEKFKAGEAYETLTEKVRNHPLIKTSSQNNTIEVVEFFSYGCPACNYLDQPLKDWSNKLPKDSNVKFSRIPVEFHKAWQAYARAYYVAENLDILDKIDAPLFKAVHENNEDLSDTANMRNFFIKYGGISGDDFDKNYNSFSVNRALERGKMFMGINKVRAVPTVVINYEYKTDLQMAKGLDNFIQVLNHLVQKAKTS